MGQKQRITPGVTYCSSGSLFAETGEEIAKNSIVYVSETTNGGRMVVKKASAAAAATCTGQLFVTMHYAPSGERVEVHPGPVVLVDKDTSGDAIQDEMKLTDAAGGADTTGGVVARSVGAVTHVSATEGTWLFTGTAGAVPA